MLVFLKKMTCEGEYRHNAIQKQQQRITYVTSNNLRVVKHTRDIYTNKISQKFQLLAESSQSAVKISTKIIKTKLQKW